MENELGKSSRQIFKECGFDENMITVRRIHECGKRWWNLRKENKKIGLYDTRGRPLERNLNEDETSDYLEAENHFLKELEKIERRSLKRTKSK